MRALLLINAPKEEGRPDRFESLQPGTLLHESNLIIVTIIFACSRVFKEQNSSYLLSNLIKEQLVLGNPSKIGLLMTLLIR